jgi:Zn-dependent membrane protease YugP
MTISYWWILLIGIALGGLTQFWVNSSFKKYSQVPLATGQTGAQVARSMLDANGLAEVEIERVQGRLSDHYDPKANVLRLSPEVHDARSVAAAGVASHEAGHAVQHDRAFVFAGLRTALVPAARIGSNLAFPMIFLGLFIQISGLITLGIILFAAAVLFQLVTLPVEFDASRRAMASLASGGQLPPDQVTGARRVLTAAAMTYLAATLVSIMQLLYFIGLRR